MKKPSRTPGRIYEITALSNPRVKSIRALSMKKNRDQTGLFIVEGMKLVMDAHEGGWEIDTLVFAKEVGDRETVADLAAKIRVSGADILEVNEKILTSITRKDNPQAVVALVRQQWAMPPDNVTDNKAVWIGLDRVRDPGNLGTIIRTADSAGANGIILIGDTTDPFSLEATRATMGSVFNVPLVRMTQEAFIQWQAGWAGLTVGTHLLGAVDFRSIDYSSKPVLLLMGNEQQGLTDDLAGVCDELAFIPMSGRADSLNLAIATGVFLFQMGKQLPALNNGEVV